MVNPIVFAQDAYGELRKVAWIPRRQMMASTFVVIILVAIVSLYISLIDFLVAQFFGIIIRI
ncbi:MAG: preprotein translocase subunit SecE [Elusimicrobia bacterium]|nr:preprotein translocase subunit SecE [Elusimicrobiota bacterium]